MRSAEAAERAVDILDRQYLGNMFVKAFQVGVVKTSSCPFHWCLEGVTEGCGYAYTRNVA